MFVEPARLSTTVIVELKLNDDLGGHLIGDFMLRREDAWSQREVNDQASGAQAELGWVLDPCLHRFRVRHHQAVQELLRYCFQDLCVHRVIANCFLDNDTSWRLMERLGMRRELHAASGSLHRSGQWLDTLGYAILLQEWTNPTTHSPPQTDREGTPDPTTSQARRGEPTDPATIRTTCRHRVARAPLGKSTTVAAEPKGSSTVPRLRVPEPSPQLTNQPQLTAMRYG